MGGIGKLLNILELMRVISEGNSVQDELQCPTYLGSIQSEN